MAFFRSLMLFVCGQVVVSVTLLRREEDADAASDYAAEVDEATEETTSLEHIYADRLEVLEEAYGGASSFYGGAAGLFGTEAGDEEALVQADAWAKDGKAMSPGIYGEILPAGMLKMLRELSVRPGEVFMDLGSGAGKFPAIASKIRGMRAKGIELIERRHKAGCNALTKLSELAGARDGGDGSSLASLGSIPMGHVQLVHGSFFDYDISDADVIFMDSVEWSEDMMKQLGEMCQGLKPGARVMTWKELPGEGFEHNGSIHVPITWDENGDDWQVYRKVGEANKTALLGKKTLLTQEEGGPVNEYSCDY